MVNIQIIHLNEPSDSVPHPPTDFTVSNISKDGHAQFNWKVLTQGDNIDSFIIQVGSDMYRLAGTSNSVIVDLSMYQEVEEVDVSIFCLDKCNVRSAVVSQTVFLHQLKNSSTAVEEFLS